MDRKPRDIHQASLVSESPHQSAKTSKMRGAHLLGLAAALGSGVTPSETSVSRALKTRNGIAHAIHVSRETLNRPHDPNSNSKLEIADSHAAVVTWSQHNLRRINRKEKRKARMRMRRRQGRWC